MEVFSLKVAEESNETKITGQGVVYCEMKSRQNSEADLLDVNLRRELCGRYEGENPILFRFKWECGGLTTDIATLSIEEIISFHRCFYNPANISIIICGRLTDDLESNLLTLISSILKPVNCYESSEKFIDDDNDATILTGSRIVNFPSNEDDLGSVGFAWPGASAKDLTRVLSFHVIFKYLRETSSSPLYQHFVQIEKPWATDIDYEIKPLFQTFMTLIFSGVPYRPDDESENGLVPNRIRSLLKQVMTSLTKNIEKFEQMIRYCLSSFELKLIELIEDDPYETIVSYTIPELIISAIDGNNKSETFGMNVSCLKKVVNELKNKSMDHWISLLQYLIEVEPVEVIMIPDVKLNDLIDQEEKEYLLELYSSGKARVSEIPKIVPYNIQGNFELMTDSKVTPFSKEVTSKGVHVIELPGTGLKQIIRLVNFKKFIPESLWSHLVLYQELLFQCDVDLSGCADMKNILQYSDDFLSYQLLQKILNSKFNSYGINFGLENDTFSLGYCEEALNWTVTLPSATCDLLLNDCLMVLETIATCSLFSVDRIKIVAENLYNQIQDLQKDPYEVTESILTISLHELNRCSSISNLKKVKLENDGKVFENEISMFKQKSFLKRISRGESSVIKEALKKLNSIKDCMKLGLKSPSFIQIGSNPGVVQAEISGKSFEYETLAGRDNFDLSRLPKFGHLSLKSSRRGIAYSIGDITASYMSFVIPCNVLPAGKEEDEEVESSIDFVSISLICQLLSLTEGPIYSAIRGRGLAYDASLTLSLWNGLLTFSVNDSNDPVTAFKEFQKLMQQVDEEFKNEHWNIISEDSLKVAKSAFLYQMIEESATSSSMFNSCLRNHLRAIPMNSSSQQEDPIMKIIRQASRADLAKAWKTHFSSLISGDALTFLVVPKSISESILTQFSGIIDFEMKSFTDFAGIEDELDDDSEDDSESDSGGSDSDSDSNSNSTDSENGDTSDSD